MQPPTAETKVKHYIDAVDGMEYGKIDRAPDSHRIALSVGLSKRALDRKQQHTENSILFESALLKH